MDNSNLNFVLILNEYIHIEINNKLIFFIFFRVKYISINEFLTHVEDFVNIITINDSKIQDEL